MCGRIQERQKERQTEIYSMAREKKGIKSQGKQKVWNSRRSEKVK